MLRTCALTAFQIQIVDYSNRVDYCTAWMDEVKHNTVISLLAIVSNDGVMVMPLEHERIAAELTAAIDDYRKGVGHLKPVGKHEQSTNPATIAPQLSEPSEDGTTPRIAEITVASGPKQPSPTRAAFLDPILAAKGWSILDWANEARVAYHTARDYHDGTKTPYASTRLKLATALGVPIEKLPR